MREEEEKATQVEGREAMTREELKAQRCPMGGTHNLTQPIRWIGASCRKCHKTWEGTGLTPTWPEETDD